MTITPSDPVNPSISVRIWLRVCSRSSCPPRDTPPPRVRPMASSSSMKMIAGATFFASLKRSRTRLAPTPTTISMNSEADIEKKGTLASPATALASRVFPVPGGPESRTPLGIAPPRRVYFPGLLRKSTISVSSALASSIPATSSKVVRWSEASNRLALLLPRPPMPPRAEPARRHMDTKIHRRSSVGPKPKRSCCQKGRCSGSSAEISTLLSRKVSTRLSSAQHGRTVENNSAVSLASSGSGLRFDEAALDRVALREDGLYPSGFDGVEELGVGDSSSSGGSEKRATSGTSWRRTGRGRGSGPGGWVAASAGLDWLALVVLNGRDAFDLPLGRSSWGFFRALSGWSRLKGTDRPKYRGLLSGCSFAS